MLKITNHEEIRDFAINNRLRPDWHEPDEVGVNARIVGDHLDNAFGSTLEPICTHPDGTELAEFNVVLVRETFGADGETAKEDIAVVNLATLLAIAAAPRDGDRPVQVERDRIGEGGLVEQAEPAQKSTEEALVELIGRQNEILGQMQASLDKGVEQADSKYELFGQMRDSLAGIRQSVH